MRRRAIALFGPALCALALAIAAPLAGQPPDRAAGAASSAPSPSPPKADPPPTANIDRAVEYGSDRIEKGKHRDAYPVLMEARLRLGKTRDVRIEALLGRVALAENAPEKALEFVKPWADKVDRYDPVLAEAYLVSGEACHALGRNQQALVTFDWVAGKADGKVLILAAKGCGEALIAMKEYPKAVEALDFALRYANSDTYYQQFGKLLYQIRSLLAQARRLADIDLYGEDFVLYREAETGRRLQKNFKCAQEIYQDIRLRFPQGPYADPAQLYEAVCLLEMDKLKEAKALLAALRQSNPYGPYAGEALLELGRIALEHYVEPKAALGCFELLDTWIQEVRAKPVLNITKRAVPEAAVKVTTPPKEEKYVDFWGDVKRSEIKPGMLVSAATCSWYLDDLAEECATYLGFLYFAEGDKEKALEWYKKILDYDPMTRRLDTSGQWNDYSRLKWGVEHGYLYAYPQELAQFKDPRRKLAVLLTDLYYVTQQWDRAGGMAQRLLKGQFGALGPAEKEYPQLAYAGSVYWSEGRDKAIPEFLKVVRGGTEHLATFTQQRAAYGAANLSLHVADKKVRADCRELLVELVRSPHQNEYTYKARIALAQSLIQEGRKAEGIDILNSFPKDAGPYKELAVYFVAQYAKDNSH
jgi:tetratricopeptide (TPR) repeat protein